MTVPVPTQNPDLHGNVPESSPVALLLVDVINDMAFEGAESLVRQSVPMAHRLAALKRRARGEDSRGLHQRQLRPLEVGLPQARRALSE